MAKPFSLPAAPKTTWMNQYRARREKYLMRVEHASHRLEAISQGADPEYPGEAARALAVLLSRSSLSEREIAAETSLTANTVRRVLHRFELYGLPGLQDPAPRHQSGQPARLPRALPAAP